MLEAMHEVSVTPGDGVYIPPGLPHAIGAGVFLLELQEPEDLSILLEWKGFNVDGVVDGARSGIHNRFAGCRTPPVHGAGTSRTCHKGGWRRGSISKR